MSLHLIETLESACKNIAQEFDKDASVLVQFAAGDWAKIKDALKAARAKWDEDTAAQAAATAPAEPPAPDPVPAPEPEVAAPAPAQDEAPESTLE